jgi:ectoine hydroxylase-related dioxygenase (phytanoyl-CoA dioxygenase family)
MNALGKLVTQAYAARRGLARALYFGAAAPHEAARRLAEDGIVVMPGLMPAHRLEEAAKINRGAFDYANAKDLIYSGDGVKLLNADTVPAEDFAKHYFLIHKNYNLKFDVYEHLNPLISAILKAYYRSNFYFREVDCYRSQAVSSELEYKGSFAWHRDNYPPGSLKVMLYLTDVAEENGPLTYALGSHKGFAPELGKYGDRIPREEVEGKLEVFPCIGKKGTVILFNNNGIHRAANPVRGYREVVNSLILPSVTGVRPAVNGTSLETEYTFIRKYTR